MPTIAGASQYLNASALANVRGVAPSTPTLLSQSSTALSLLDSGRNLSAGRFGLSSSARIVNQQFLSNSANINQMFSLGVGIDATIEGAQKQILALRAGTPDSKLARSLRAEDSGAVSASRTGRSVNTKV